MRGHFKTTPIPIALHVNTSGAQDFTSEEIQAFMSAADTWNKFFGTSKSIQIFDYSNPLNPSQALPAGFDNTSSNSGTAGFCNGITGLINSNQSFTQSVIFYKLSNWPVETLGSDLYAITELCPHVSTSSDDPYNFFFNAIVLFNYQNYFVNGMPSADLESVMLHELGHLLGLGHSCEANSTITGMPDCNDANLDPNYQIAVMYPGLQIGQQKRTLGTNDQSRVNCLY